MTSRGIPIEKVEARAFCVPTDGPEADGTLAWDRTTIVVVNLWAGDHCGLGYTYSSSAVVPLINKTLASVIVGEDVFAIPKLWKTMIRAVRNLGWRGICANGIAAIDIALWDAKARLFGIPLVQLFGAARDSVPIYGSGGFTTYSDSRLADQLGGWAHTDGCRFVKMKIGSEPERDPHRMRIAREAVGDAVALMIDANGAFERKQALMLAQNTVDLRVAWFEEPVSSDDLEGLRLLRDRMPAGIEVAAGEYGYEPLYFKRMMDSGAVDVIQADATRCCGYTGFLEAAALADAQPLPMSAHTAPALHLPICCAAPRLRHIEWFYDHTRIERLFFEGAPTPEAGVIRPDLSRPGHGLTLKAADAGRFAV